MTITWNEKADAKLLAGIIAISPSSIDFNALAEYMGDGVTVSALRHRIARLRAKAEEGHEGSSSVSPVAKKRQRTPKKSDKATAGKAKDADAESGGEGGASKDGENQTEGVKARKAKKPKIKHEEIKDSLLSSDSIKAEEDSSDI
ncbi:hypothetical protein N7516_006381 [Penicillium verrucosum]|uniref:uncharacterized protein n=1 Tax=Penicillium verrucosum TaxID=60171 RepID=UPI00254578B3|nr:uncharacterized protein N7516_006381 [Penicillium verrucosum]KAJ5931892.1 hypothetical protein N7516_006381 [Penicillium verrucosum]